VLVGLLAVATMPAAIVATRYFEEYELLDAGFAIPVGMALGVGAVALARRARRRIERTLGRAGGRRTAAVGRLLGLLGFCLAATAAISVGTYALLTILSE
jgi:drug/metabolite transporter (DMT)-like permease